MLIVETINIDDKDSKLIKNILKKIRALFDFMYLAGDEMYRLNSSIYSQIIPTAEMRELRKKLNEYFNAFQGENERLLQYTAKYPRLMKLYELSLGVRAERFESRLNAPPSIINFDDREC